MVVPRWASLRVMTHAPPNAATSDIYAAQSPASTPARRGARCRRCVSLVGKSPSGHLFESLTCGYSPSSLDSPELHPHTVVLNPN